MTKKKLLIAGIVLALLLMLVGGLGLYRQLSPAGAEIEATIVIEESPRGIEENTDFAGK